MALTRAEFLRATGYSMLGLALPAFLAGGDVVWDRVIRHSRARPFLKEGSRQGNQVALTFDDGPTPRVTEAILKELAQRDVRATFFMIGQCVALFPDLARAVQAGGHEIGNHGFSHSSLIVPPHDHVNWEIQTAQQTIKEATGQTPRWFRPPGGAFRDDQRFIPESHGLDIALWSVESHDWERPGEDSIVRSVLSEVLPGSIIHCHDLHDQTAGCLGRMLDGLLARGFQCGTVSDVLGA